MFHFENNSWQWGWSNYGNTTSGSNLYNYRNNLTSGDYNGDGRDEILGVSSYDMRMLNFADGDFSNNWSGNKAHSLWQYRDGFISGDFDSDGKNEILGNDIDGNGWITMFHFENGNWNWGWSDEGSGALRPYREKLIPGKFNSGKTDHILGIANWATEFYSSRMNWGWSTYSLSYLSDWPIENTDNSIKYIFIKADSDKPEYLLTFKNIKNNDCDTYLVNMYMYTNKSNDILLKRQ